MKDQARKTSKSRSRKVWVIKTADGQEYDTFVVNKQDAVAVARKQGLKVSAVYKTNERWNSK